MDKYVCVHMLRMGTCMYKCMHTFIRMIFSQGLLNARHCASSWEYGGEQKKNYLNPLKVYWLAEKAKSE